MLGLTVRWRTERHPSRHNDLVRNPCPLPVRIAFGQHDQSWHPCHGRVRRRPTIIFSRADASSRITTLSRDLLGTTRTVVSFGIAMSITAIVTFQRSRAMPKKKDS